LSELRSALLDQHPSMREEARYHMREREQIDVAEFYREILSAGEGSTFYAALCGLGEAGTTQDALLIAPHTSHPTSKVRWAAIKALAKLNSGQYIDLFMDALKDPIPYVSREALNALASRRGAFNGERIWKILQSASTTHVKRNVFSLIEKLGKWDSIYYLVRSVRDSDETIAAMGQFGIQRWLAGVNRSFTSPSSEQLTTLRKALEETGNLLDAETMRQLQFSMKGFN
jgi:HEAT repeat protein